MVVKSKKGKVTYTNSKKPKTVFGKGDPKSVSRTKQSFRDECNINSIMDKVNRHMINTKVNPRVPKYGDYSNMPDYATALNQTIQVRNAFNALPAKTRSRFENDPQQLVEFMDNPDNIDEARELGLLPKDLSNVKYVDGNGNDVTDKIFAERGFYVDGVRVNRDGTPYEAVTTPDPVPPVEKPEESTTT